MNTEALIPEDEQSKPGNGDTGSSSAEDTGKKSSAEATKVTKKKPASRKPVSTAPNKDSEAPKSAEIPPVPETNTPAAEALIPKIEEPVNEAGKKTSEEKVGLKESVVSEQEPTISPDVKPEPKKAAARIASKQPKATDIKKQPGKAPLKPAADLTPEVAKITIKKSAGRTASKEKTATSTPPKKSAPPKDITPQVKKITSKSASKASKQVQAQETKAKPAKAKGKTAPKVNSPVAVEGVSSISPVPQQPPLSKEATGIRKIIFQIRFYTRFGQSLSVIGNHHLLGNNNVEKAFPLQYLDDDHWYGILEVPEGEVIDTPIMYNYLFTDVDGTTIRDWGNDRVIDATNNVQELMQIDSWNDPSFIENNFFTEPFKNVILKENYTPVAVEKPATYTHVFKVKAPLLQKGQVVCLLGAGEGLKEWDITQPILMERREDLDHFIAKLNLSGTSFPIVYKYGVYDVNSQAFVRFEEGNNRIAFDSVSAGKLTILNDGFVVISSNSFRGAGVAIPVFSLRSTQGFGVGEFNDIRLLVDWAKHVGLRLVQILPINDTTATHTFADSYPYAAISAFALHPMYLHIPAIISNADASIVTELEEQRLELQALPQIDYETVMRLKWELLRKIYPAEKEETFASDNFQKFFEDNKHWLVPYAAFSYFRDENGTADFSKWSSHGEFDAEEVTGVAGDPNTAADDVAIHFFIQYHLHLQLQDATRYAHANGIILKGDIPIGIYRNSCDAWQQPELYNMEMQAGAPPDDFAIKGQNWGFPTYNWQRMQQDGFTWWKLRFEQMSNYFDAFRIDHILGFFRIWSIPMHAVEGIMGHFVPALPVHVDELIERGISFIKQRFTEPYITDAILADTFNGQQDYVKEEFLESAGNGFYQLKSAFKTQRNVEAHFSALDATPETDQLKQGLYDLISNVLLFEVEGSHGQQFHIRIAIEQTSSFKHLDSHSQHQLRDLYINYFFHRQDSFWEREAMHKLPDLKRSTNMLICGEDLGMVPDCVPGVMKQLSILSLEIQRMPKDINREFFHPNDAPYLSVVTPSTHDMSTIRGWWEEDRSKTQQFFNHQLGQWGDAPYYCEPWINKAIVFQHLYSPAMWSIFQLQDLLGSSDTLRRENPNDERINIPADPKHYWRYRLHLPLEELVEQDAFNTDLRNSIYASGR